MKHKLKIAGIITVLSMLFACNEEFLEKPAQGNLDATTLANPAGVEGNLIAAYSMLDGYANYGEWGGTSSNWIWGSVASDNSYKGSEPGDQQPTQDVELYQWGTGGADGYLNGKWEVTYDGINRANATIILMNSILDQIPEDDFKRIRGEAVFLRAHYHFEAWKMWKNIPYYTEVDEDFRKTNVGTDALPLIVADLEEAISLLPPGQAEVGRVNSWVAKAVLGRVLVYQENWTDALTVLTDVVNNGPYMLEENFHNTFAVAHNNGPETILAYQASVNDGNPDGQNGNRNDRLNFPHSGSPFGCCGFHQPSQNLVNLFKVGADGLPLPDGTWNDADLTPSDVVDPRLDWTTGRDDVPFLDWGTHDPGWIRDRAWAGPYSPKKNIYEQASGAGSAVGWATYQLHSMNTHLLRFADVMLYLAEAEIHAGSVDNAMALINEIRVRAAAGAQGPEGGDVVVPIDDATITWASYDVKPYPSGMDAASAMKALKMERRLELAMEGHRFFDLRRWGDAETVLNDYLAVEATKRNYLTASYPYTARHALYPIPTIQIELSKVEGENRLVQNDGW